MTNAFSQIVLRAASVVENVHLRAVLSEVAYGEHGKVQRGTARRSHPWLLHTLGESIGLDPAKVRPLAPTIAFLEWLAGTVDEPLRALAAIGVGNERLIVPEYNAIKLCFEQTWPEALHEPFLNANIREDRIHYRLCYEAASRMLAAGAPREEFMAAAIGSIDNRITYFSGLATLVQES